MQDRSEIFRRIKQQYFREQLAPLGFQPMDGMILYLLWGRNCLRQEDIAAQTALDKGGSSPECGPSGGAWLSGALGE